MYRGSCRLDVNTQTSSFLLVPRQLSVISARRTSDEWAAVHLRVDQRTFRFGGICGVDARESIGGESARLLAGAVLRAGVRLLLL